MKNVALNTEYDGTCRTIKAQYYKNSMANFIRTDSFGAAGVIVIYEVSHEQEGLASAGSLQGNRIDTGANY